MEKKRSVICILMIAAAFLVLAGMYFLVAAPRISFISSGTLMTVRDSAEPAVFNGGSRAVPVSQLETTASHRAVDAVINEDGAPPMALFPIRGL